MGANTYRVVSSFATVELPLAPTTRKQRRSAGSLRRRRSCSRTRLRSRCQSTIGSPSLAGPLLAAGPGGPVPSRQVPSDHRRRRCGADLRRLPRRGARQDRQPHLRQPGAAGGVPSGRSPPTRRVDAWSPAAACYFPGRWVWAWWPSRSNSTITSAGPSTAFTECGVMVANSAASPASTVSSRSPSTRRTRPSST
jgi:hypothetical protein